MWYTRGTSEQLKHRKPLNQLRLKGFTISFSMDDAPRTY